MARIFTTKFTFNHQTYDAIVTMLNTDGKLNFNIKVLDNDLHEILPGGLINYEGKEGFKNIKPGNQMTQSLIHSIANAIEHHLVVQP
jgi:hypothetical protein